MSVCSEHILKIWSLNNTEKKVNVLNKIRMDPCRVISNFLLLNSD